jgi:hypothetical protein
MNKYSMLYRPCLYNFYGWFPKNIVDTLSNFSFTDPLTIAVGTFGFNTDVTYDLLEDTIHLIIVDCSHHPWQHFPIPDKFCDIPVIGLTGFYDTCTTKVSHEWQYFYYPFYFAGPSCIDEYQSNFSSSSNVKKFKFSCLNRSPKSERIWFYTQLFKQNFYNDSITSFFNNYPYDSPQVDLFDLDYDTKEYFNKYISPLLPICLDTDCENYFTSEIYHNHPAYTDTYINIISEHSYQDKFLSEKSVKPIVSEQLYLMAGPAGAVKKLEQLGFDTYKDIIDHTYYDNEDNWQSRLNKMLEVAADLSKQNLEKINKETYVRRANNHKYFFSQDFQNIIFNPIIECINQKLKI